MKLSELDEPSLRVLLTSGGLNLSTPPFIFRIRSNLASVATSVAKAYSDFQAVDAPCRIDFDLELFPVTGIRRWLKPLVTLAIDGGAPFDPLPMPQAYPLLEWGMNWCVTSTAHHLMMCHSAVLAWNDYAVVLPAPPGSGKSTLCAALALSGWRLLSDELALLDPETLSLVPFVRPVSLKNASIEVIGHRYREAIFTAPVSDTIKGTVAHMRPPTGSVSQPQKLAKPRWLVFPQYQSGSQLTMTTMPKAEALAELAGNSFNISLLGTKGFSALAGLVDSVECYRLQYASLDDAIAAFSAFANQVNREPN